MKIDKKLMWLYILSAAIYACQGFEGLPGTAMFAYLKEHLHFSPEKIMYIGSIISIPWLIKPIFGYFIDQYLSKKAWIILSLVGSIIISLCFGLSPFLSISFIIAISMLGSYFTATRDISNDGLACVEGKENDTCDIFQNVQWTAITIAGIVVSLAGGFIADHLSYRFAYLCLIPIYLCIIGVVLKYKPRLSTNTVIESCISCTAFDTCDRSENHCCANYKQQKDSLWTTICSYKELFTNKSFLLGCLFIFLYNFSPSFGTPLSFIERDVFKWSWTFMGTLGAITSVASILGSILYYKLAKNINTDKILFWSVFIGASTTLAYLYFTPISAIVYGILFSIIGMFIFLNVMTFMAKSSIKGKEATSFALLCSINNLAATSGTLVGAYLFPKIGLQPLIILAAATSFLCLPLISRLGIRKEKK
jgi:predicted MFS family arabinose efflux permease